MTIHAHRKAIGWLTSILIVVSSGSTSAQLLDTPAWSPLLAAVDRKNPSMKEILQAAGDQVGPIYIFIPGILGSKLTKTLPNGEKRTIWGNLGNFVSDDAELAYKESDDVTAEVLNEVYGVAEIYGKAIATIEFFAKTKGETVLKFPYDWRQSNVRSSAQLSTWLCANRKEIGRRPIVFMAHSMGGLVLNHWFKHRFKDEGCETAEQERKKFFGDLNVAKIIFLGTPHYGTPKAIRALADYYDLLLDAYLDNSLSRVINIKLLAKSLHLFGATFPSIYELLPIYNTTPITRRLDWPQPFEVRALGVVGSNFGVDLFDAHNWRKFGWPRNLKPELNSDEFKNQRLPQLLQSAKSFLVDLFEYNVAKDANIKTLHVYGTKETTICGIIVLQPEKVGELPTIDTKNCEKKGDGTVPDWIARKKFVVSIDDSIAADSTHTFLLSSTKFYDYLNEYHQELEREINSRYAVQGGDLDVLASAYVSIGAAVSPPNTLLNPTTVFRRLEDEVTQALNSKIIAQLQLSPKDIYALAKSEPDPIKRAKGYRLYASMTEAEDPLRAWALNNAAHIYFVKKNFATAQKLSEWAIADAPKDVAKIEYDEAKGKAALTGALSALELDDVVNAAKLKDTAIAYGNFKAQAFSLEGRFEPN